MSHPYGPWATLITAGPSPQLSAFWRQRLGMLVPVSRSRPTLSRRNVFWLTIAALMICLLPTLRAAPAAAEENRPPVATVHVVAEMRTGPRDNYAMISPECKLVTVEIWRDFGKGRKWRVEKPGRVVAMDGASTLGFLRPNLAYKLPVATEGAFDSGPLLQLAQDQDALARLTKSAKAKGWKFTLTDQTTAAGEKKRVLTVEARCKLPDGDYMKNKFLDDSNSDTHRVYRFDAGTQRLEHVEFYLHQSTGDTLILKTSRIEYNRPLDPKTFAIELPKDVRWIHETTTLPDNEKYERMTPTQAAKAFFEACAKQDWPEAEKFWPGGMDDRVKKALGGLALIHLGEPFQSKFFARSGKGWFVPYEIKLKDGSVKKFNLAVRKDNPANRYVVDGGI